MSGLLGGGQVATVEAQRRLPLILLLLCLTIFLASPVRQAGDSFYALLLSHNLLTGDGFRLDRYFEPPLDPARYPGLTETGLPYQIHHRRGHYYYVFPPGTSLLSAPLLPPARLLGLSPLSSDGRYDSHGDRRLGKRIAALLCAGFVVMVFKLARLELTPAWSAAVAIAFALGSQVWSTASRALWSHTWLLLLSVLVVRQLLVWERGDGRLQPIWLATLLAWGCITRPTAAVPLVAVALYVLVRDRRSILAYAIAGLGWLALFAAYARQDFGSWLPPYYSPQRAGLSTLGEALAGNLVSPARGLLIFLPHLLFLGYLLVRYRRSLPHRPLIVLGLVVVAGHWLLVSSVGQWWGGYGYGPRLMTDVVPWLVLLTILALRAWLDASGEGIPLVSRRRVECVAVATLTLAALLINGGGALSKAANRWNESPTPIDRDPSRLWDWSDPQCLAWMRGRGEPTP